MVLSRDSHNYQVGKLIQAEFLGRLGFWLLVESRDPYLAALGQKLIPVCPANWLRQWRQAQEPEGGEQLFPTPSTAPLQPLTLLQGLSSSRIELLDTRGHHIQT